MPTPSTAVLFLAVVAVLFSSGGIVLRAYLGEPGLMAAEWLLLFVPAVAVVRFGGFDPVATLSLRRPSSAALAGGAILWIGTMPVAWFIGWLQTFFLPVPMEVLERLDELVRADSVRRLVWLMALLAVTPALCEEVVFRGVLLGSTRHLAPARLILLNGLLFGAFHLSLETPVRFLPTAWLGIVITWAVWRTGSLWIGVLMHVLNNGAVVVLASVPTSVDLVGDPHAPPPLWLAPLAAVGLWLGFRTLERLPRPAGRDDAVTTSIHGHGIP